MVFVNKMDRLGANFDGAVKSLGTRLGANAVPIQIPIGAENEFQGMIDLVEMKAYIYETPEAAQHVIKDIPDEYKEAATQARENMIEKVAEADDDIMAKFLEEEEITKEELKAGIRRTTIAMKVFPVLCGSALKHRGVHPLLDAVLDYLPSPLDLPPTEANIPNSEETYALSSDPNGELAALAFKINVDKHVGRLTYLRIYSGTLEAGANVYNTFTRNKERIGRLLKMHAESREEIKTASAGEIVAAIGLKKVTTGNTICMQNKPLILESIEFPEPVISMAVEAKSKTDQDKMGEALVRLVEEDPTLHTYTDQDSNQVVLAGMGELHLDIIIQRVKREFGIEVIPGAPKVAYRETILGTAEAQGSLCVRRVVTDSTVTVP